MRCIFFLLAPEPLTPMLPPVGLKAIVLSSSTVVLYWTDTTLSRNQVVTDNRYYTVRYTAYIYSSAPKYRYFNSSDLNCMIDDLKPNTQYEFSVKVVKGKRESTWSMSILNTTEEAGLFMFMSLFFLNANTMHFNSDYI